MRSAGDSWDINNSVGLTALIVAASRALITEELDPPCEDPYARILVEASNYPQTNILLNPKLWSDDLSEMFRWMKVFIAVRTRIIDEAIQEAVNRGVQQLVILAAGLDTRPYRLDFLQGVTSFEIDQAQVLEFKNRTLHHNHVTAYSNHTSIAADLRFNWIDKLLTAGLDPQQPIIWLTEGLLIYLPGEAQWNLAHTIDQNSVPGSRWILDISDSALSTVIKNSPHNSTLDISTLLFDENVPSSIDFVADWKVRTETIGANLEQYPHLANLGDSSHISSKEDKNPYAIDMMNFGFYIADK